MTLQELYLQSLATYGIKHFSLDTSEDDLDEVYRPRYTVCAHRFVNYTPYVDNSPLARFACIHCDQEK